MIGGAWKVRTANPNYHVSEDDRNREEDDIFGAFVDRNTVAQSDKAISCRVGAQGVVLTCEDHTGSERSRS